MSDNFSYDVFLSHSTKDKEIVRAVAERLRKEGINVWFDEWSIKPGDGTQRKIEEGLDHSRVLLLCMSANAFGSDWARLESQTLRFRDPLNKDRRFVPLRIDNTLIKGSLGQFVFLDWWPADDKKVFAELVEACRPSGKEIAAEPQDTNDRLAKKVIQLEIGSEASIFAYAFSPNRKLVLGSGEDSSIRMWDLETGGCINVFKGHAGTINAITWAADGHRALSVSNDKTIRVWDVATGDCLHVFEHQYRPEAMAWSADQRRLLVGDGGGVLGLWDLETGIYTEFDQHASFLPSLAWSRNEQQALSAASDRSVLLWDVRNRVLLKRLKGHTHAVGSIVWSPDQRHALSGDDGGTIRLWHVESGRCLRVFEGHAGTIDSLAWSPDHGNALSGSQDATLRYWNVETGACLRVLEGHTSYVRSVVWSLADGDAYSADSTGIIRIWDSKEFATDRRTVKSREPTVDTAPGHVQYMNAKVLLVGDTGVGKSGLAERLVNKQFVPTKSSHARKAYVLESNVVQEPNGILLNQETVLWDLAGQPAYRLVHQLSMEDAALACVLFDNRNETNPFEGPSYWSQVLEQARTNTSLKKLLVASRVDVGGLPSSKERIETFTREHDFADFIPTSSYTGEGCNELLDAIRTRIAWDEVPKVTTTTTLAAMRDYVSRLKGDVSARLFTIAKLHEGFVAHFGDKIPLDEFIAHLQRLEATDDVDLLVFKTTGVPPGSEDKVLLDPTRVDAYASALLVAARDEPDGPGHLLESRIRDGEFKLDQAERIADRDSERHVLWFVIENLLARDLALREIIKGKDYVVFPSQCTAELRFPGVAAFGVAFAFAGPVRSIYATLIAQLAHYERFTKREFFQDAAAYCAGAGGRFLVRLHDHGHGQGELEVLFEDETSAHIRQGFLEFVGKHLQAKSTPGSVTKRHAYHCANKECRNLFEDRVVKARLITRKRNLICPICEEKTPLFDLLAAPTAAAASVATKIDTDAKAGRQRMTAAFVIKAKEAESKFDVFLSHNSKDKTNVEKIAKQLLKVGIRPWLDKWNLAPGDTVSDALEQVIKTVPCAALCFGPADMGKWHIMEIRAYVEKWASGTARMIPVLLPEVKETPELPLFVRQTLWVDMREWEKAGSDGFYRLVCGILGRAPGDSPMKKFGVRDVADWQGRFPK